MAEIVHKTIRIVAIMTVSSNASCQNFMIYFGATEQILHYTGTNYQLECERCELCMSKSDYFFCQSAVIKLTFHIKLSFQGARMAKWKPKGTTKVNFYTKID